MSQKIEDFFEGCNLENIASDATTICIRTDNNKCTEIISNLDKYLDKNGYRVKRYVYMSASRVKFNICKNYNIFNMIITIICLSVILIMMVVLIYISL